MNKILYFILIASIQISTLGYDLKLVGKFKNTSVYNDETFIIQTSIIKQIDEDGKMDVFLLPFGINFIMDKNGYYIIPKIPNEIIEEPNYQTNIIGTILENNVLKVIQSETRTEHRYTLDTSVLFKTFSKNGYSMVINELVSVHSNVFKLSANSNDLISQSSKNYSKFLIIDFNNESKITKKSVFNGNYVIQDNYSQYNLKSKYNVSTEFKDGYIYVYYITSTTSPYFLNSTKLSINTVGGSSISGTIETQTTNSISIQSSDNISDWKTIQTIQNPSGKQFVVPANKPQEFIRAIE
jgi:hypothetical protein